MIYTAEADDDGVCRQSWILADGAMIDEVAGGFDKSPDGRYLAARSDLRGTSFVLYDQVEHVRYWYDAADAGDVFIRLFRTPPDAGFFADGASGPDSLAAILATAERTPLFAWRGLWIEQDELARVGDDVLTRELAAGLVLTATVIGPADARTLENPYDLVDAPIRRIAVNGHKTPYLCEHLDQAMASDDGTMLIVKGCVIDEDYEPAGARWYLRRANRVWVTLDDALHSMAGNWSNDLGSIASLTQTGARFELGAPLPEDKDLFVFASTRARPFKVRAQADPSGGPATCLVPYQKFV